MLCTTNYIAHLRQFLTNRFSLSELKDIAFDIGVDYEMLTHEHKGELARNLIVHLQKDDRLSCLVVQVLVRRYDKKLAELLENLPECTPLKKTIVVPEMLSKHAEEWLAELAREQIISEDEVALIAMAHGSIQLLVGVSENALHALQRAHSTETVREHRIASVVDYEDLDPVKKRAWRFIATQKPPVRRDGDLLPTISFAQAAEKASQLLRSEESPPEPGDEIWSFLKSMPARLVDPPLPVMEEVARIVEFAKNVSTNRALASVFNFYAPARYGRTTLLRKISKQTKRLFPTSFVGVGQYVSGTDIDLATLLRHILDELLEQLPIEQFQSPFGFELPQDEEGLAQVLLELAQNVQMFGKVIVLLMDDYDAMPNEAQLWFEHSLLDGLIRNESAVVVLTSEVKPLQFESFPIRMRCEHHAFLGFDTKSIRSLFPAYEPLASQLYWITGGIPVLVSKLVAFLEKSGVKTRKDFQEQERALVTEFFRAYVPMLLEDMNAAMQKTLMALASLRHFDAYVMRNVLPSSLPRLYREEDTSYYLSLLNRLKQNRAIAWNTSYESYAFADDALRTVLQKYTLIEHPDVLRRVNSAALSFYRDVLRKQFLPSYVVELLYHALVLHRLEVMSEPYDIQLRLEEELLHVLVPHRADLTTEALNALGHAITQDPELSRWISQEVWERYLVHLREGE